MAAPGICQGCGRFIGPEARCPFCGRAGRLGLRALRWASLAVAVAGVLVLLLVARRSGVPGVAIGDLAPTMNWAYVRVEGVACRQPVLDSETGALKLWIRDVTGEIMAMAYRAEAEALRAAGRVPAMGDALAVEGTLRIKEDFHYLVVNLPQAVEIRPAEVTSIPIGHVHAGLALQRLRLRGAVRGQRSPYAGLHILSLRDASGEIEVLLPSEDGPAGGPLRPGQALEVTGAVDLYQGVPQLVVARWSDLGFLDAEVAVALPRRTGEVNRGDLGKMARVRGLVDAVRPLSSGLKLSLDDGSGQVTVLLWNDLLAALRGAELLSQGATVEVQGEVAEYRGELEVVPQIPADLLFLAPAARVVAARHTGELSANDVGQVVRVEGVLRTLRSFSAGQKGLLDDGTGPVTLLLWQDVWDGLAGPEQVAPGALLWVEGHVTWFGGEPEIVPESAAGVTVTGRVDLPLPRVALGQLQAEDAGQVVEVKGEVTGAVPFSRGIKYTLDDGTGLVVLLLWQEVLDGLEGRQGLAVGDKVIARGEVAVYGGGLEIVPRSETDLEVTTPAAITGTQAGAIATPGAQATAHPSPEPSALPATPAASPLPTPSSTPQPPARSIGSLTNGDAGSYVTLARAGIAQVSYFSRGIKYTLTDATGSITLLLWQNVVEEMPIRLDLFPGSQIQVSGKVQEYQGALELVPGKPSDVRLLNRGERAPLEERALGAITASDEGRVFAVAGAVVRTENRGWLRLWLNDGSGELLIFVPERLVPYLPAELVPGRQVAVTGEVDVYQGTLEIIPLAGADIVRR